MRVPPCLTLIDHKEHNIFHFRKFLIHPEIHQISIYRQKRYVSYPNYFFSLLSVYMFVHTHTHTHTHTQIYKQSVTNFRNPKGPDISTLTEPKHFLIAKRVTFR